MVSSPETCQLPSQCLVVSMDGYRYGFGLHVVERVIRLVEITPLPQAPRIVRGVVDIRGAVLPVIDLRRRFRLPEREPHITDALVLARTQRRRLALLVEAVGPVEVIDPADWTEPIAVVPRTDHIAGVVKQRDGLILIHDLETCLSLEEEDAFQTALAKGSAAG